MQRVTKKAFSFSLSLSLSFSFSLALSLSLSLASSCLIHILKRTLPMSPCTTGPMWWEQHCGNWWCPPWVTNSSAANPYAFRPFMLRIASSVNVHVDNITFKDPGFWCVVPTHSNYVSVKNVVIDANGGGESPNTDGMYRQFPIVFLKSRDWIHEH